MIMSFLFIALSAALGVGMWFLVIGIVFSIGGGDLFIVTHYDSLFFILLFFVVYRELSFVYKTSIREGLTALAPYLCGYNYALLFLTPWLS